MGSNTSEILWQRLLNLLNLAFYHPVFTLNDVWQLDGYDQVSDPDRLSKLLNEDRQRLNKWLGIRIEGIGKKGSYSLRNIAPQSRDLFLPDELVAILAVARQLPQMQAYFLPDVLDRVLNTIRCRLGTESYLVDNALKDIYGHIPLRDKDVISSRTRQFLHESILNRTIIKFNYDSAREDGAIIHHQVEPYQLVIKNGHLYLDGFCLQTESHVGKYDLMCHYYYRIGRILSESLQLTDQQYDARRERPLHEVHYVLSARLSKHGPSQLSRRKHHFTELPDGRLEIKTHTNDLFETTRQLLSYGSECQVCGGELLLKQYRREMQKLYSMYTLDKE